MNLLQRIVVRSIHTMCCFYVLLQFVVIVCCYCVFLVCVVAVYFCCVLLCVVTASWCYMLLLCVVIFQLLLCVFTFCCYFFSLLFAFTPIRCCCFPFSKFTTIQNSISNKTPSTIFAARSYPVGYPKVFYSKYHRRLLHQVRVRKEG